MRYGIISDIHASREALEIVLTELDTCRIDCLLCAGDIVGYGADPAECVTILRDRGALTVSGNHDAAVYSEMIIRRFTPAARTAMLWTRSELNPAAADYLAALPLTMDVSGDVTLVHGTLDLPGEYKYMIDETDIRQSAAIMETQLLVVGHSHVPALFACLPGGSVSRLPAAEPIRLETGITYIINAGSVGQPRDGDPRACYTIFDSKSRMIQLRRITYDVEGVRKKILSSGLPRILADRLSEGL